MTQPSPLTLGTVQLGMAYGSVVRTARPAEADAFTLLDAAWDAGVTGFDTAAAYGDAESVLGRWIAKRARAPFIMTKLDKSVHADEVPAAVSGQARTLGVVCIDALLVHDPDQLTPSMADILHGLEADGVIGGFGASVYTVRHAIAALGARGLSFIQAPFSVADRRFETAGVLDRAAGGNVRFFARSLFLQGVLLQDPGTLPDTLDGLREPIAALGELAIAAGVSVLALCLAAARHPVVTSRLIGVADERQLSANLKAESEAVSADTVREAVGLFQDVPGALVDPRTWTS